jgi:hypothetical protein
MTILEYIAVLIIALRQRESVTTDRLLYELEARMDPEELAELLEAILTDKPVSQRLSSIAPIPVLCA